MNKQKQELMAVLDTANEHAQDFSDGAWFAFLEESAEYWLQENHLNWDANGMVHEWIESRGK